MNPNRFIETSDYATLRNDSDAQTLTVNVPGGVSIPVGGVVSFTNTLEIGSAGAPMNIRLNYSADSRWWVGTEAIQIVEATPNYRGYVFAYRSAPSTLTLAVYLYNSGGAATNTVARTASVSVRTYLPPFS